MNVHKILEKFFEWKFCSYGVEGKEYSNFLEDIQISIEKF